MNSLPNLVPTDWFSDVLPDSIWVAVLVSHFGNEGPALFRSLQEEVVESVGEDVLEHVECDGRLTTLEAFPRSARDVVVSALPRLSRALFPQDFLHAVALLPAPGKWLFEAVGLPESPDGEVSMTCLANALVNTAQDSHSNALTRTASLNWRMMRRQISFGGQIADLLTDYPLDDAKRDAADSMIRAQSGAMRHFDDDSQVAATQAWAELFWRSVFDQTNCYTEADLPPLDDSEDQEERADEPTVSQEELDGHLRSVSDLYGAFSVKASETSFATTEPGQVILGLVSRAARLTWNLLLAPHMWSGEFAAGTIRSLAESRITLKWLQHNGPDEYSRYTDYGLGKLELMLRHLESRIEDLGDDVPDELRQSEEYLKKQVGGEWTQMFQDVDVGPTFSGKSLRAMAKTVAELDLYNHTFQPATGALHGEWWAISEYSMDRCLNPLHRFHSIPTSDPYGSVDAGLPTRLTELLATVIEAGESALEHLE